MSYVLRFVLEESDDDDDEAPGARATNSECVVESV